MYMPQLKVSQFVRLLSWENKWYNPCVSVCIPCEKTKGTQSKAMNLKKWIVNREQIGRPCFSRQEVADDFRSLSAGALDSALSRFSRNKLIQSVHRGYYCVIPPRYVRVGRLPPEYYIESLMQWLGKPYYVALLSAAAVYGAQHQKVMVTQVMVQMPHATTSAKKNPDVNWLYRQHIPAEFLVRRNGESDVVTYSNPELTAIDLVRYADKAGGLSNISTVLAELREVTNFKGASGGVFTTAGVTDIQRLGYIYEVVLGDSAQSDVIYSELAKMDVAVHLAALNPSMPDDASSVVNKRWRLHINTEIELDEL
jgi:predicted transcriptional regulator of viral defense system